MQVLRIVNPPPPTPTSPHHHPNPIPDTHIQNQQVFLIQTCYLSITVLYVNPDQFHYNLSKGTNRQIGFYFWARQLYALENYSCTVAMFAICFFSELHEKRKIITKRNIGNKINYHFCVFLQKSLFCSFTDKQRGQKQTTAES